MEDQPMSFGDYAPRDFEGYFQGAVTARDALRMSLNVPAVMVLDRIGPLRFSLALANAGARLVYPTRDTAPSLPIALGGLGISLADITMLYAGIAEGGEARAAALCRRCAAGREPPHVRPRRGLVSARHPRAAWRCPKAGRWARAFRASASSRSRQARPTASAMHGRWASRNDYTVGVWVGRADGAPSAGRIGREAAAPILLHTFELLPADRRPDGPPPSGAIVAVSTADLPPSLRIFTRQIEGQPPPLQTNVPPPSISFPPNGATVPIPAATAKDRAVLFKADGGREPLTWLVNGQLLGSFDRFQPVLFEPDSEGFARVTVVDAQGRSDTANIRFKRQH